MNRSSSEHVPGQSRAYVLTDTGATVRVIGKDERDRAENVRLLSRPVQVHGAGGCTVVRYMADLPGYGGLVHLGSFGYA